MPLGGKNRRLTLQEQETCMVLQPCYQMLILPTPHVDHWAEIGTRFRQKVFCCRVCKQKKRRGVNPPPHKNIFCANNASTLQEGCGARELALLQAAGRSWS